MGDAISWLINQIFLLIFIFLFVQAVISWLILFNVINLSHPAARQVVDFLNAVTEPMLRPLRRFVPRLGGVDITPIVLILLLGFIQVLFNNTLGAALRAGP